MISIAVPIYNVENHLPRCIDSILIQTYKDLEIILVDDGSTDSSGKICEDYAKRDDRIRVIHIDNTGLPNARNIGLNNSKGEYILMVDGDDVLHPQMVETLYGLINSGDYDFSMCYGVRIFDIEKIKERVSVPLKDFSSIQLTRDSCMRDLYLGGNNVEIQFHVVWNKLYKRELLENLYFVDTASQDTEYNSRVYQRIDKAVLTKEILYYWIQRSDSITHLGINENYANVIYSYLVCLNEIPVDNILYRSFCLRHMYRVMALHRYRTKGYPCHKVAVKHCNTLLKTTTREFLNHPLIPSFEKYRLFLFNYCPAFYNLFMKLLEIQTSISKWYNCMLS